MTKLFNSITTKLNMKEDITLILEMIAILGMMALAFNYLFIPIAHLLITKKSLGLLMILFITSLDQIL